MLSKSTLKRAKTITEQSTAPPVKPELYQGRDFGVRGILDKLPGGGKYYDALVAPEVGGYQMPGVARSIVPALSSVMYQQALERGAGPGSVMGGAGGVLGGAGFGALAGSAAFTGKKAEKARELFPDLYTKDADGNVKEIQVDKELKRQDPERFRRLSRQRKFRGIGGYATQLGAAALGSVIGGAGGAVAGSVEGFLGGRSSGAGILGGGAASGIAAGIGSIIPATGLGTRAWPALTIASAAGYIGSELLSNVVKNVESTRKRLAVGGAEGSIIPQGPIAQRVG